MATPTTLPSTFVAGSVLTAAEMNALRGAFRILQVVSTAKTDVFTMSSTSYADITGLNVSITPSSNTSKVLLLASVSLSATQSYVAALRLLRDNTTPLFVGDAAGSRTQATMMVQTGTTSDIMSVSVVYLDSPATTSAVDYDVQVAAPSGQSVLINRGPTDTDSSGRARTASSIVALEVSA